VTPEKHRTPEKHLTPQQYSRVKHLFSQAIGLPQDDWREFLNKTCPDDAEVRHEVDDLLRHHHADTILAAVSTFGETHLPENAGSARDATSDNTPDVSASTLFVEPAGDARSDVALFNPLLSDAVVDEFRQDLRQRLTGVTAVLSVGVLFGLTHHFFHPHAFGLIVRAVTFVLMATCFIVLRSRLTLSLAGLRGIEIAAITMIGGASVVIDMRAILDAARLNDVARVVNAHNWNFFGWSLIILVYGMFMPNTWRRAAAVLTPAACVPYAVLFAVCLWSEQATLILREQLAGLQMAAPAIALFASVYAAQMIHGVRQEAIRARRFAQYRLTRLIGAGGMGEVYEAEHLLLKRPCAIKLIRPGLHADPKALSRFEREVKATAKLSHWNTIEIYDYGRTSEAVFYYVMELLPGMSLEELVHRFGAMPAERAVHFLLQACAALTEAHDAGLIHRDIKPANIFAAERGGVQDVAKLLDFGLVLESKNDGPVQLTAQHTFGGSPLYMSPEQATAFSAADARSDIYSLGAAAYFLLTARAPFAGDNIMQVVIAHAKDAVAPLADSGANIPADVEQIVLRCLEKDPAGRFQSAREMADALSRTACAGSWTPEKARQWWAATET